ncbi:MAG: hypothetical protein H7039_00270, partial [Bryobacteraceae bacterium]|nr:hypothetical protein [Bryobacteraceae bacterium]
MPRNTLFSRRAFLQAGSAAVLWTATRPAWAVDAQPPIPIFRETMLAEMQKRACLYFWECADPVTGLVLDRTNARAKDDRRVSSIAATGFGLSALCIADRHGFGKSSELKARAERTLEFFARRAFHQNGFFFHFLDMSTGERQFNCELSSIDTAWLLCGIIHA